MSEDAANAPDVTIGLVVYNGEDHIDRALCSLRNQTDGNFRLIVSDNASSDGTEAICRRHASEDSRIVYIRQPRNVGPIANFWSVLALADTPYFMWASHDDKWEPEFIQRLKNLLKVNPDAGLAYCWTHVIDPDSEAIRYDFRPAGSPTASPLRNFLAEHRGPCVNKYYGLYRTAILKGFDHRKYPIFDYQDTLLIDYINLNTRTVVTPHFLFNYSEVADKQRKSLAPRRAWHGWLGRLYKFDHGAYVSACLRLVFASPLSLRDKVMGAGGFLFLFGISKVGQLLRRPTGGAVRA